MTWLLLYYGLPAVTMLFALWAQGKVKSTFVRFSKVGTRSGLTGAEVAKLILRSRGIADVTVEPVGGTLTDHYDPRSRTLRLSEAVHDSRSIAAVGVAAHEVGHAIQHADAYGWLTFRSNLVPVVGIGSRLVGFLFPVAFFLFLFGSSLSVPFLTVIAYALAAVVVFSLVTLPVELDASSRAIRILDGSGVLVGDEVDGARQVLNAAAWTYVAAAAAAIGQLVQVLLMLLSSQRRD